MTQLDRGASQAGTRVLSTAESLKRIATELRSDELSRPSAQLADRGAQTLEQLGRYLESSDGNRLIADAERFGRERPWVIASVGAAIGLAGSRMLKASAARRYRSDTAGYSGSSPSYGTSVGTEYRNAYAAKDVQPTPVSSDAAPVVAKRAASTPSSTPSSTPLTTPTTMPATISKGSEASRLTMSDGS